MTLYDNLEGDGLIAFSDPAGAKAGLSVATILSRIAPDRKVRLVSNMYYSFYADWEFEVEIIDKLPHSLPENINWVFTGTSHPTTSDRFELEYLQLANDRNIFSFAFIDHWYYMAIRFDDGMGKLILPSRIIVIDEYAKKLAVEDGLSSDLLIVYLNPYLDYIENFWRPAITDICFRKQLNLEPDIPIITYAPDPLTLIGEDKEYGFDEGQVLDELLQIITPYSCYVLVKAHPSQPEGILERVISNYPNAMVYLIKIQVDNLELMANSQLILGLYSNFLIEAAALGKNIIRYFPTLAADPIEHLDIGEKIVGVNQLKKSIRKTFSDTKK